MSASESPPEAWILICCSLPVPLSLALTLTIPLASISKVTSICGTPRRAEAEAKNNADSLVHATERQLEENGDKIDAELKAEIEAAIAEAKTAIESGDADAMTAKTQELTDKAMKMGQAIYEKEQATAASPGGDASAEDAEDVVDAEFSEVDENKG